MIEARGACSCGWRGSWRTTQTDANLDVKTHCLATGHQVPCRRCERVFDVSELLDGSGRLVGFCFECDRRCGRHED